MESALSPLYTRWLEELLASPVPRETRATCQDCAMCKGLEPPDETHTDFNPRTKCCTYMPGLPNFLVGGILQNEDPDFAENREQFEREAIKRVVTPYGIRAPWIYWVRYYDRPFGQSEKMLCPYYIDRDGGLCGIYQYRNSRCSTWFCKYESGKFSLDFWRAVDQLLTVLEEELAKWCIQTIDLKRSLDTTDGPAFVWGVWVGRERDFYRKCWEIVHQLTLQQAVENAGDAARPLVDPVLTTFASLKSALIPNVLYPGKFITYKIGEHLTRVRGYSKLDPVDLSNDIVVAIAAFDGRPVPTVLESLQQQGISIDGDLLRILYQHKILVSDPVA